MKNMSCFILISMASDFKDEPSTPSFLAKDYHLSSMASIFQKKFWPKLKDLDIEKVVETLEEVFTAENCALKHDIIAMEAIAYGAADADQKVKALTALYEKAHFRSENCVLILIAKLVFANEHWFTNNEEEAKKLFPDQTFNQKFFDTRRNLMCLFARKK